MTYKAKKSAWDYKQKVDVPSVCGTHKVSLYEFASFVGGVAEAFDFIVCLEKLNEDWGLTDAIGKYAMGEVVTLLADHPEFDDDQWRAETITTLKSWLDRLEKVSKK